MSERDGRRANPTTEAGGLRPTQLINRVIDRHWGRALDSQADDYVLDDGSVGPIDEATYFRYKVNSLRITRQELDELYRREATGG